MTKVGARDRAQLVVLGVPGGPRRALTPYCGRSTRKCLRWDDAEHPPPGRPWICHHTTQERDMIEVQHLTKTYGHKVAVDDV